MVTIKFLISNLPPQPRNSSHTLRQVVRGGKVQHFMGKTEMALMFEKDLTHRLSRLAKENLTGLDYLEYALVVGTPSKEFWTAKNEVSKTSIDFDAHKVFTDVVAKELGFNDGQIVCHQYMKVPVESPYWYFAVSIYATKSKGIVKTYTKEEFLEQFKGHTKL